MPKASTVRKPRLWNTRGARNFEEKAPTAVTKVIMPDWNGVSPKPSCSIKGKRNGIAPMPMRNSEPPRMPARNSG